MNKVCVFFILCSLLILHNAYAEEERFSTGLSIEYPSLWSRETVDDTVILKNPDEKVAIIGFEFPATNMQAALQFHNEALSKHIDDVVIMRSHDDSFSAFTNFKQQFHDAI